MIIMGILLIVFLWLLVIIVRNHLTYEATTKAIDLISKQCSEDIKAGRDWGWRMREYDNDISYEKMVFLYLFTNPYKYYMSKDYVKAIHQE